MSEHFGTISMKDTLETFDDFKNNLNCNNRTIELVVSTDHVAAPVDIVSNILTKIVFCYFKYLIDKSLKKFAFTQQLFNKKHSLFYICFLCF